MIDKKTILETLEEEIHLAEYWEEDSRDIDVVLLKSVLKLLKEQEAKTGHWILDPNGMDWNISAWKCSECHHKHDGLPIMDGVNEKNIYRWAGSRFCPNCGVRMVAK